MIANYHTHTWRCMHASGTEREYVEKACGALELCRMQQIDGVVYFCQWGCKQTMGAAQLFKSALEAEGYPVLLLDGDGCDRANTMDGQTATRLDAFLEMLHSKQEALV
mgnify:CR=1 FL=1